MIGKKAVLLLPPGLKPQNGSIRVTQPPALEVCRQGRETLPFHREAIQVLVRTLAARDPYTGLHSKRVTKIALFFARTLGVSSRELQSLAKAGYLHDIGKIGVCDSILRKPGPLTPDERAIIETHPLIGERIVEPLALSDRERDLILLHHEHWNGQGYPFGLSGTKIPFLCRILALADVFDALISNRPYRRAFTVEEALEQIESQIGRQFDPDLGRKFIRLIRNLGKEGLSQITLQSPREKHRWRALD